VDGLSLLLYLQAPGKSWAKQDVSSSLPHRFEYPLTCRASLNKLAIRGIRSFDDKHVQVIEFYSPLTVIVGHNGSGKTVSYCSALIEDEADTASDHH
jgi:hypothetical protein